MMTTAKTKLVYTKKINEGKLSLAQMEVGATIAGKLKSYTKLQNGTPVLTLELPGGKLVEVYTSGNVRQFFDSDLEQGQYEIGNTLIITRKEDRKTNTGRSMTQFYKSVKDSSGVPVRTTPSSSLPQSSGVSKKQELQNKLNAARSKANG